MAPDQKSTSQSAMPLSKPSAGPQRSSPEMYRPSFAQVRLWVHEQLLSGSSLYNLPIGLRLEGKLDLEALRESLRRVIAHHEVLRTSYPPQDGYASVHISPEAKFDFEFHDLSQFEEGQREPLARKLVLDSATRRFDVASGPLVRLGIVKLSETLHLMALTVHHIVADQGSLQILALDVAQGYRALRAGGLFELQEPLFQYLDYALWERNVFDQGGMARQLEFWKKQLAGSSRVDLPGSSCFPLKSSPKGILERIILPGDLFRRISDLGRNERCTMFVTLFAALCVLLRHYAGRDDISVATPTETRKHKGTAALMGLFVNNVILRTDLTGAPTFRELLKRVRNVVLQALVNEDLPFDKLLEAIRVRRTFDENPLFNVVFTMASAGFRCPDFGDLEAKLLEEELSTAKFDLTIIAIISDKSLELWFEHKGNRFGQEMLGKIAGQYQNLMQEIVEDPDQPITSYSLLKSSEYVSLLPLGGASIHAAAEPLTVCQIVSGQAQKTPLAPAVSLEGKTMSYRELERLSNRWARWFIARGADGAASILIALPECLELPAVALGALKAGACYAIVSPDATWPSLSDAAAQLRPGLVLSHRNAKGLDAIGNAIILEYDAAGLEQFSADPLDRLPDPFSAATVLFTSGTLALPSPVVVNHTALAQLFFASSIFSLEGSPVWALCHAQGSGMALWEMWAPLLCGGSIAMASSADKESAAKFASFLGRRRVSVLVQSPLDFSTLIDPDAPAAASSLDVHTVLLTGEMPDCSAIRAFAQRGTATRIFNVYSCAEHPVPMTVCELLPQDQGGLWPLGKPAAGTAIYVLNGAMQPAAIGAIGEIYVSDEGFTHGYPGDPVKTATSFVPNPFSSTVGARLFKTGDLARVRPDLGLEFQGRGNSESFIPKNVIRDAVLLFRQHPGVRWAAARARRPEPGDEADVLVYVEPRSATAVSGRELEEYLGSNLPESSLCKVIVVEALPRNNGKTIALHVLQESKTVEDKQARFVHPRQETEAVLARIWAELLGMEKVSVEENFFSLGGDSILALQMVRMAAKAGLKFKVRQVFQAQTIARLALLVCSQKSSSASQRPTIQTAHVPLTPIQSWFFEQNFANPHHWNQSILLEVSAPVFHHADWPKVLQAVIGHHEVFRNRFEFDGAAWQQRRSDAAPPVTLERIDLSNVADEERSLLISRAIESAHGRLDISNGYLFAAVLFDLGEDRPGRLFMVAHHLVMDAVSWRILVEDIATGCGQTQKGEPVSLSRPAATFQEWAQHLEGRLRAAKPDALSWIAPASEIFWGVAPDHCEGVNTEESSSSAEFILENEQTDQLREIIGGKYQATVEHFLIASLGQAVLEGAPNRILCLELEHHGRNSSDMDLSRTIGWFTALYPVYLEISTGALGEAAQKIAEHLGNIPDYGDFGILRYMVRDPRVASESRPCIRFNYLGQLDQSLPLTGGFRMAAESAGVQRAGGNLRTTEIEITSWIVEGKLHTRWMFSRNIHSLSTIQSLVRVQQKSLASLLHEYAGSAVSPELARGASISSAMPEIKNMLAGDTGIEDIVDLSPAQEKMVLQSMVDAGNTVDQYQLSCDWRGPLDSGLLTQSWQMMVSRHRLLRSCFFVTADGVPIRIVRKEARLSVDVLDWRDKPAAELARDAELFLPENLQRPGQLASPPLLRLTAILGPDNQHKLVCLGPALFFDRWSLFALLQQSMSCYFSLLHSRPVDEERRAHFSGRSRTTEMKSEEVNGFSAEYMDEISAGFQPSFLKFAPERRTNGHSTFRRSLDAGTSLLLAKQLELRGISFESLAQGLWGVLLNHYARSEEAFFEIELPLPSAELQAPEEIALLGRLLPVRIPVRREMPVDQWLRAIEDAHCARTAPEATRRPKGNYSSAGITLLTFEYGLPDLAENGKGIEVRNVEVARSFERDFTVVFAQGPEWTLRITFAEDRCDAQSVRTVLHELVMLCELISKQPRNVGELLEALQEEKSRREALRDAEYDRLRASRLRKAMRKTSLSV